jgi:hypothetical protein
MTFEVLPGVPHVEGTWRYLMHGLERGSLTAPERAFAKKLAKAIKHLTENPFHPGLHSHEIAALSDRYGQKVFESYLENNTPGAGRLFWVYGPGRAQITLIGLEPHPDDKRSAYDRVQLSALPSIAARNDTSQPSPGPRPRKRK